MLNVKIALAAALTLVSGAAFAANGSHQTKIDMSRVSIERTSMDRVVGTEPRADSGFNASAPTIWGHAPLGLHYDRPLHNGS